MRLRSVVAAGVSALVLLPAAAGAADATTAGTCTLEGARWTLYPAHSTTAKHGTRYRVVLNAIGCRKAKRFVRRLWNANPTWPVPTRAHPDATLKGAPAGFRCSSTADSARNRHTYAGSCIGTDPAAGYRSFSFGPLMSAG